LLINLIYIHFFFNIKSYSDEEDSRTQLVATWAKTPNLRKELEKQKNINPDDIFGGYRPCHLDGRYYIINYTKYINRYKKTRFLYINFFFINLIYFFFFFFFLFYNRNF